MEIDKCFYSAGDLVQVKHDIEFKPVMWIVEKCQRHIKNSDTGDYESCFIGMKCRWFNANGDLQEAIFNTKDLELVK